MDALKVAEFLSALRVEGRTVPVTAAEALCRIGAGTDTVLALQTQMKLDPGGVSRLVSFLRGRARFKGGRWVSGGPALVLVRNHPHSRGFQLLLSPEGQQLLQKLGTNVPNMAGAMPCTSAIAGP